MAMDVGGSKGGPKSDINVTPLVDVMLVLLIIMMLVAPMLQKGVDVKLPLATNTVRQARERPADGARRRCAGQVLRQRPSRCPRAEMADRVKAPSRRRPSASC